MLTQNTQRGERKEEREHARGRESERARDREREREREKERERVKGERSLAFGSFFICYSSLWACPL